MSHPHRSLWTLVLSILLLALVTAPAWADSAPPPPPSGALGPGEEQTQVRMMAETVTLKIAGQSASATGQAQINASFTMRNLGSVEEKMEARFPLQTVYDTGPNQFQCIDVGFPPITDMVVKVDGKPAAVRTEKVTVSNFHRVSPSDPEKVDMPCWGHFWVTFPPGKDVAIDVTYTSTGGLGKYSPYEADQIFYYVLQTGAGWKDTIGSADIIVQSPIALNDQTLVSASPQGYTVNGNELRWHLENLEPTFGDNIRVAILEPARWNALEKAREGVKANPESAADWTALAYAAHQSILLGAPFELTAEDMNQPLNGLLLWSDGATVLATESKLAYQKAIALEPQAIDLRLHYASLLWQDSYNHYPDEAAVQQSAQGALEQIQAALKIDPGSQKAQHMLDYLAGLPWGDHKMIDLSQPTPVYYFLTPLPTMTPTPGAEPSGTPLPPPAVTSTATPVTEAAVTTTSPLSGQNAGESTATDVPTAGNAGTEPAGTSPWPWLVVGAVAALAAGLVIARRRG